MTLSEDFLGDCFAVINNITVGNKARYVQYRIIHRISTTKSFYINTISPKLLHTVLNIILNKI